MARRIRQTCGPVYLVVAETHGGGRVRLHRCGTFRAAERAARRATAHGASYRRIVVLEQLPSPPWETVVLTVDLPGRHP